MSALQTALEMAGTQHGVVSVRDLRANGYRRRQMHRLVAAGHLRWHGTHSLVVAGYRRSLEQRMVIAAVESGGIISHRSAAQVHGIGRWPADQPIDVLLTRDRPRRSDALGDAVRLHSTTDLPPEDIVVVRSVPCTSVARTLLLVAGLAEVSADSLRGLVDDAVRANQASDKWLWWRLESLRRRGRPGIAKLEAVLTDRAEGAVTESWLERQFLQVLADQGLPLPLCQRRVERDGAFVARVDFAFEPARLAIEVNGHAHHSSAEQLSRDAHRRNQLHLAGYRVLDFTYDQIVQSPADVAATVRAALS